MARIVQRVSRPQAAILVVDIQERLLPAIFERERVLANAIRLLKGAEVLGVPVLATEQYRKGLGPTAAAVLEAMPGVPVLEKLAFNACGAEGLLPALNANNIRDVLLCGIESHVCVLQTCLDLLARDYRVFVMQDAVSSRTRENWMCGVERMRDAGAVIASTEMALFELLERAGTQEFKRILELVK